MANSKATAAAAGDVLIERLEAPRQRLFQARGIVEVVRKGLDEEGEVGDNLEAQPFWWSLTVVSELLRDIANQLEPSAISKRVEVAHV
jgi:hypothetical protein